jgi:hypothetical protein
VARRAAARVPDSEARLALGSSGAAIHMTAIWRSLRRCSRRASLSSHDRWYVRSHAGSRACAGGCPSAGASACSGSACSPGSYGTPGTMRPPATAFLAPSCPALCADLVCVRLTVSAACGGGERSGACARARLCARAAGPCIVWPPAVCVAGHRGALRDHYRFDRCRWIRPVSVWPVSM